MKKKTSDKGGRVLRILLKLSFLPYAAVLLYGLYGAFFGVDAFFSTAVGWDGFFWASLGMIVVLTIVPVLPLSIVFQIACGAKGIYAFVTKDYVPEENSGKKNDGWKAFIIIGIMGLAATAYLLSKIYPYFF